MLGKDSIAVAVSIHGEVERHGATIAHKMLEKSLIGGLISPYMRERHKEEKGKHNHYSLQMIRHVHVAGTEIALNHSASGLSVYSPARDVLTGAGGGAGERIDIVLTLHPDEEAAQPRFLSKLMSGLHLHSASAAFRLYLGSFGMQTELNKKWLSKPAFEALVGPFLEVYNARGEGPEIREADIVGLTIEGVSSPSGGAALRAAPKEFAVAGGATTHVHLQVKPELQNAIPGGAMSGGVHARLGLSGSEFDDLLNEDDIGFTFDRI